jgi:hypothetical protein
LISKVFSDTDGTWTLLWEVEDSGKSDAIGQAGDPNGQNNS